MIPHLDYYAAPPDVRERFDFIAWLDGFQRGDPVVWLYRRTRTTFRIGHVEGDRYPTGTGTENVGLWAPAIVKPTSLALDASATYGYGTRTAALVAYVHDLQAESSPQFANLTARDDDLARLIEIASSVDDRERVLMRGRATLHDLGAWPWGVVGDGVLPERVQWWQRDDFVNALRDWDENRGAEASIDPWPLR